MIGVRRLIGGDADPKRALRPLYALLVAEARRPFWYAEAHVPDTLDGRFDMLALTLSLALIRLEQDGDAGRAPSTHLAELFVDDIDPQLRELGIGDLVVGKHVGRMMGALGGRLAAYREGLSGAGHLEDALARNLWRGNPPDALAIERAAMAARALAARLAATPLSDLLAGRMLAS